MPLRERGRKKSKTVVNTMFCLEVATVGSYAPMLCELNKELFVCLMITR
jgi:hypothetical protein